MTKQEAIKIAGREKVERLMKIEERIVRIINSGDPILTSGDIAESSEAEAAAGMSYDWFSSQFTLAGAE